MCDAPSALDCPSGDIWSGGLTLGAEYPNWIGLLPRDIKILVEAKMTRVTLRAGVMLYERNEQSNGIYRLRSGRMRLFFLTENGQELVLKMLEPNETVGELATLDGLPRHVFAETLTDCELDLLPVSDFHSLRRTHPEIDSALVTFLSSIIRTLLQLVEEAAIYPLRARVAARLCWLVDSAAAKGGTIESLAISQKDLGLMVGAARQAVNRILGDFAAIGATKTSYGKIIIHNISQLRQIAAQKET